MRAVGDEWRMTMTHHLKQENAQRQRDRFDREVKRVATNGTYYVEPWGPFWKVSKRWKRTG